MARALPTHRRLVATCLVLVTLTAASVAAALTGAHGLAGALGLAETAVVLGAALIKALAILNEYLNLRAGSSGWRAFFVVFLAAVVAVVLGAQALILSGP